MMYSIGTVAKKTGISSYTLRYYDKAGLTPFVKRDDQLQALADKYGVTKNAIATAWILRHPAQMQVILG